MFLGDRAYKIKKPVALDFLDFRSREARERIAHREVELNRRLAPDVYLGVADVHDPAGRPCDHVVVMRRLPDDRRLGTLVDAGADVGEALRAVARTMAQFHATATRSTTIDAAGSIQAVRHRIETDLRQLRATSAGILDARTVDELTELTSVYLKGRSTLFEARVAGGRICDGHGDLLADDIFCLDDGPRVLDCLEFDDGLRYGDVLADVAFLAMDLEHRGGPVLAWQLLAWYAEFSGERHPESLAHYYIAQRALVRAKVACVRSGQGDPDAARRARELADLAIEHLRRGRIRLVLVGGSPGTGKSTLAAGLSDRLGWTVFRSDEIRKDLVGRGHADRLVGAPDRGIYDTATSGATYDAMLARAARTLALGESVILDASWSTAERREAAARLAEATGSRLVEIRCEAPADVAQARVTQRLAAAGDASDADASIEQLLRARFEPWPTASTVSTEDPAARVVQRTVEQLARHDPDAER